MEQLKGLLKVLALKHTCNVSIFRFNFLPYTVELNYQSNLMKTREEIAVVWLGPIMNILIFILLVLFCWISQKLFGLFPDIGCKFTISYGLMTLLDPLLILAVDCILKVHICQWSQFFFSFSS